MLIIQLSQAYGTYSFNNEFIVTKVRTLSKINLDNYGVT